MIQSTQTPNQNRAARKCQFCAKPYMPGALHQRFCHTRCRKAAFEKRRMKQLLAEVLAEMQIGKRQAQQVLKKARQIRSSGNEK